MACISRTAVLIFFQVHFLFIVFCVEIQWQYNRLQIGPNAKGTPLKSQILWIKMNIKNEKVVNGGDWKNSWARHPSSSSEAGDNKAAHSRPPVTGTTRRRYSKEDHRCVMDCDFESKSDMRGYWQKSMIPTSNISNWKANDIDWIIDERLWSFILGHRLRLKLTGAK